MGDSDTGYTMQSTSKPFNYAIAHEILGDDLHEFVGREPSGNFQRNIFIFFFQFYYCWIWESSSSRSKVGFFFNFLRS